MIQLCIIALSTVLIGSRVAIALILTGLIIWFLYLSLLKKIYCIIGILIVSSISFNRLEFKDSNLKYNLLKFSTLVSSEGEYKSPRKKALNAFSKIINDKPVVFLLKGFGYDGFRLKLSENTGFANSLQSSEGKHAELDLVDMSGSLGVVATLIILYGYLAVLGRIYWKATVFVLGAVAGHVFFNTIMLVFWIGINEKVRFSYWNRELE